MFNIYLGIYIIAALVVILFGTHKFFTTQRTVTALIFLAGSLAIFSIYGIRWFGSDSSLFSGAPVSWPPNVNTCPDYLMYFKRTTSSGSVDTCIDTIGVSRNSALSVFPADGTTNPPQNDSYYFPLATQSTNPADKNNELCKRAIQYGLTWEGISNGESCMGPNNTPVPPGGGPSGSGSGNCPQLLGSKH
jgi:hypothetical protein